MNHRGFPYARLRAIEQAADRLLFLMSPLDGVMDAPTCRAQRELRKLIRRRGEKNPIMDVVDAAHRLLRERNPTYDELFAWVRALHKAIA